MIKQGILNFFKNLKYFFTPLGTLALGLIIGLSVFIPGVLSSLTAFTKSVQAILTDANVDFALLSENVASAVRALDWNDPLAAVGTMLHDDWLMRTLNECVSPFVESAEVYTAQFEEATAAFTGDLATYSAAVVACLFLGFIGGFFLTRWLIRRNVARRSVWKYFLHSFVDSLLSATLVAVCVWLISVWKPSILITCFLSVVLFGFISLLEAYIVHAWKKVDIRRIVNAKNIGKLFLGDVLVLLSAGVCTLSAIALTNAFVGGFVGVVFWEIALIVTGLNAEAYTKSVVEEWA